MKKAAGILLILFFSIMLYLTVFSQTMLDKTIPSVTGRSIESGYLEDVFYSQIVPEEAVFRNENGDYLFEIIEKQSPLGVRYYVKKVKAEILAADPDKALYAVSTAVPAGSRIVTGSQEDLEDGDIVMVIDGKE